MSKEVILTRVRIRGTGHYVPDHVVSNKELEKSVSTKDTWIRSTLGIEERRIASPEESTSTMAINAANEALKNAKLRPEDIGSIILATTTPDRLAPATAPKIQAAIGAINACAFDINAVCAGFIYAMTVGAQFIQTGMSRNTLVIGADTFSRITDWSRRDCVFFGDGAGAVVLSESTSDSDFICSKLYADGNGYEYFTVPAGGSEMPANQFTIARGKHYFKMNGRKVYETATEVIPAALKCVLNKAGLSRQDIDHVIPHQPSIGILRESAKKIGIPFNKFHTNMDKYANTSSSTIPLLLSEVNSKNLIKPGQIVAFVAVGAGWTWGASLIRW